MTDPRGESAVRRRLAVRHPSELVEHRERERREATEVEGEIEGVTLAVEVLVELAPRRVDRPRRAQHARPGDPCQAVELLVGIAAERDRREPALEAATNSGPMGDSTTSKPTSIRSSRDRGVAETVVEVG